MAIKKKVAAVLDRVITWILYGLILMLPLVIGRGFYEVQRPPLVTTLKLAAALLLLLWTASCVLAGELKWRRTPLDIPLAGLLLLVVVSTVFSMNWQASLFGSIRHEGLWDYFIYALLFYLSAWYLGRSEKWLTALRLVALSSVALVLMTGLQLFGADFSAFFGTKITPYAATFGYRPYYACYLLLVIPVFCYLAYREKRRWRRAAWAAGGVANLAILPLADNRAATLALLCAALAAFILLSLRSPRRRRVILTGLVVLALAAVLLVGATWSTTYGMRLRSTVTSHSSDKNATTRLSMWRSSLRMIADRPLQGYGLESFYYDYTRYMEEDMYDYMSVASSKYFAYDNPHNQTLYTGVSLGVGGIFFYLMLYLLLFRYLYRGFRDSDDPWFYGAVFGAVLAYFISVQFQYDLPPYTFYLWVLAGTAMGRMRAEEVAEEPVEEPAERAGARARLKPQLCIAASCLAVCLVAAVSVTTSVYAIRFQMADRASDSAREKAIDPDMDPADLPHIIEQAQRGISLDPYSTSYRPLLYDMLMTQARQTQSAGPVWEVIGEARQESRYSPTNWRSRFTLGQAYAYLYKTTGLEEYRQEAAGYLEQALLLYPCFQDARDILDTLGVI